MKTADASIPFPLYIFAFNFSLLLPLWSSSLTSWIPVEGQYGDKVKGLQVASQN
jgi:hypothetical protein